MVPNSIRARLTGTFALCLFLVLILAIGGLLVYTRHSTERTAAAQLRFAQDTVRSELISPEGTLIAKEIAEEQREMASEGLAMVIVDGAGQIISKSQNRIPTPPFRSDANWRIVTLKASEKTIVLAFPWRSSENALHRQMIGLAVSSLFLFLAAVAGAWWLVGRTLSPIRRLAQQAQTVSADDLRVRLTAPSQDAEVQELVTTLNDLIGRLGDTAAIRERFYAAASHELRTPLQILSGHLELARRRKRTAEEYAETVEEAYTQTQRLTGLIRSLLLLNQLESSAPPPPEIMDISLLVEEYLIPLTALIESRNLYLDNRMGSPFPVEVPPIHIEMLLRNLLENACKYGTTGGTVRIIPEIGGLSISNDFQFPDDWDMDKLFEPFYRPDTSRHSGTGGNGLGLALCRAIADANGWTLTLQRQPDILRATILFNFPDSVEISPLRGN